MSPRKESVLRQEKAGSPEPVRELSSGDVQVNIVGAETFATTNLSPVMLTPRTLKSQQLYG